MSNKKYTLLFLCTFLLASLSCKKENPAKTPEEDRLVTTVRFSLNKVGASEPVVFTYRDLDGNGGEDPTIEGGTLLANSIYFGTLEVLNETETPVINITEEIEANKKAFQFFFVVNNLDLSISYADADEDNLPIGLFTAVNTKATGTGGLVISLKENINKAGQGVAQGQIDNAGGKTLVQVNFPVEIQ